MKKKMRIVCVGGGPAGLYFAISAKLRNRDHDITVLERNPAGVTNGWGVGYWDDVLDLLYRNDPVSAREIQKASGVWDGVEVHVGGKQVAYLGGYGLSMGRKRLLDILAERATDLGVDIQFEREVKDLSEFTDADLIVASHGVNSRERQLFADHYKTDVLVGRNKYLWLGTYRVFDAFRYAFEETPFGWIWLHAYYLDAERSTCIVECSTETWKGLGLHELGADQSMSLLEQIFARHLRGNSLINQLRSVDQQLPWHNFRIIRNNTWYRDNVALIGDAAHTTHFSIGSGTKLAIGDAIALAANLDSHDDLGSGLRAYDAQRRAEVDPIQWNAVSSMRWLEDVTDVIRQDSVQFAYALSKRHRPQQPVWRYPLHLATQISALRTVRRKLVSVRRWRHAQLRERLADVHQRPFHRVQRAPLKA
ncbi:MAG TPA: FAD-dependent monooxygenase [Pseudonocardiaceae bacterium]|nr:FAD-dependent monooxygenase [Pseudonocardiaceae bacterium]